MGVSITKNKPAAKKAAQSKAMTQAAALVDEMGSTQAEIDALLEQLEPLQNKQAKIKAALSELVVPTLKPEAKTVIEGKTHEMQIGMMANSTTITDNKKLFKMLDKIEKGLVWELLSFKIGDMKKYLTPKQIEKVSNTERSGNRTMKLVKRTD